MGTAPEALDREMHRRLGIDLYNRTWTLMDSPGDEMLHCAHASAYHWMQGGGTTANRARSEWLCSRVYSILGRPEPALQHARRCLELVESAPAEMEDWDKAGAYEALTRAHLVAGQTEEARRCFALARAETEKIAEEEDRKHIEADLDALPL
jgi:glycerol-3-phosphate dehydrogenase